MLILVRLGLRAGEVARLNLDDIDWANGRLKVTGKGREHVLPLPVDGVLIRMVSCRGAA